MTDTASSETGVLSGDSALTRVTGTLFRLSGLAALVSLLVFPLYKARPAGFLPLVLAGTLLRLIGKRRATCREALEGMPEARFIFLLLFLPAVLQVLPIFVVQSQPQSDGLFVFREAQTLAQSGRFSPLTYYAPGQIAYYALFFKAFGASALVAQLCQVPLLLASVGVLYAVGQRLLPKSLARAAALAWAVYPSTLLYVLVTPYYFYLYTLCYLLMIAGWVGAAAVPAWKRSALLGGLAAGAGALTKAVLLVAPLQALAFWGLQAGTFFRRRIWAALLLLVLGMALVIAPWAARNRRLFGETVLVCTSGPLVLWSANNPESDGLYSPLPDEAHLETPEDMRRHMQLCREQARSFILAHPARFARLALRKLLHTWGTETSYVELINRHGQPLGRLDPALRFAAQTGWALLVFLWAFAGVRDLLRRAPVSTPELIAALVVLSKLVIYSLYEGGARHHLPAVPFLILYIVSTWETQSLQSATHNPKPVSQELDPP